MQCFAMLPTGISTPFLVIGVAVSDIQPQGPISAAVASDQRSEARTECAGTVEIRSCSPMTSWDFRQAELSDCSPKRNVPLSRSPTKARPPGQGKTRMTSSQTLT